MLDVGHLSGLVMDLGSKMVGCSIGASGEYADISSLIIDGIFLLTRKPLLDGRNERDVRGRFEDATINPVEDIDGVERKLVNLIMNLHSSGDRGIIPESKEHVCRSGPVAFAEGERNAGLAVRTSGVVHITITVHGDRSDTIAKRNEGLRKIVSLGFGTTKVVFASMSLLMFRLDTILDLDLLLFGTIAATGRVGFNERLQSGDLCKHHGDADNSKQTSGEDETSGLIMGGHNGEKFFTILPDANLGFRLELINRDGELADLIGRHGAIDLVSQIL
jgi:hypothetical protein